MSPRAREPGAAMTAQGPATVSGNSRPARFTSGIEVGASHRHATTGVTYWWRGTYSIDADHIVANITIPIAARAKVLVVKEARVPYGLSQAHDSIVVMQYVDALIDRTDFATVVAQ